MCFAPNSSTPTRVSTICLPICVGRLILARSCACTAQSDGTQINRALDTWREGRDARVEHRIAAHDGQRGRGWGSFLSAGALRPSPPLDSFQLEVDGSAVEFKRGMILATKEQVDTDLRDTPDSGVGLVEEKSKSLA